MSLPKTLYVVECSGSDGPWLNAGRNKSAMVEEDGEIVGTYILQKKERGKSLVEFTPVR